MVEAINMAHAWEMATTVGHRAGEDVGTNGGSFAPRRAAAALRQEAGAGHAAGEGLIAARDRHGGQGLKPVAEIQFMDSSIRRWIRSPAHGAAAQSYPAG